MENDIQNNFLQSYEPVHTQLSRFCRAISGNKADAEDLLQDTILSGLQGYSKLRDNSAFKSYLFGIASNLNKMKFRRKKFHAEFNEDEIKHLIIDTANQEYVSDFNIVYQHILQLPQRISEALILFHISDMSIDDIKKIQGGSLSGVKQRLRRGRKLLLNSLSTKESRQMAMLLLTL